MLALLPQLLVSGIAIGMLYALIALSMTILYRATTVVNFGHGDLVMVAAYLLLIFAVNASLPFVPAMIASITVLFVFGYLLHRVFIWPIINGPHLSLAMMAIAIGYSVRGLVRMEYGQESAKMPRPFDEQFYFIHDVVITLDEITFCAVVLVLLAVSYVVFAKTRFGRIVQAMFQTQRGASLVGIDVRFYNNLIWGVGVALGALGGVMLGLILVLDPDAGAWTLLRGFAAMTLGGFGSLHGAVIGGLVIGILEKVLGTYVSTAFIDITCYMVIIVVLLIRPRGLFGQHATLRI